MKQSIELAALLLLVLFICSCSTYPYDTQNAQNAFYMGDFNKSAQLLEEKAKEDSKDQLLYLLDRGMALQLQGNYKESEKSWLAADKMSEVKDYVSLSTEAATLIVNDSIKQYKGEDFEKVIINAFLAIDYAASGELDDALVEARRVNEKLYKYKFEAKRNYEQNPFARYFSGVLWEASGRMEDAYIDYKLAAELIPDFPYLKRDLIRLSKRLGRYDDLKIWQKNYGDMAVQPAKEEKKFAEIVFIFQQGRSAVKKPNPNWPQFPKFYPRSSITKRARLEVADENKSEFSEKIYSVSDVAIKTLDDAYAGLVAKRVVGIGTKAVIANQVSKQNELLGMLTWIGLNAVDKADLRHWSTLPETLQLARLQVSPGHHTIKMIGLDESGQPSGEEKVMEIDAVAAKKIFLNWRALR